MLFFLSLTLTRCELISRERLNDNGPIYAMATQEAKDGCSSFYLATSHHDNNNGPLVLLWNVPRHTKEVSAL